MLSRTLTNSFRYGFTKIDENNAGVTDSNYVTFRFITPFDGKGDTNTFTDTRQTPTQNFVNDLSWFKGLHTMKAGTNIRFTRVPKNRFQSSYLNATVNPSWVAGIGRRNMPGSAFCTVPGCSIPAVATAFQAGYADAWLNILGVLSQATQRANYNLDGTPQAPGTAVAREIASDEYQWYIQDAWQLRPEPHRDRGRPLQPLFTAVRGQRLPSGADGQHGRVVRPARGECRRRHSIEREPAGHVRPGRPEKQQAGLLRVGQEQLRAARRGGVDAGRASGRAWRILEGVRSRRRRPRNQLRRRLRVRHVDADQQPVRRSLRDQPRRAVRQLDDHAADDAGGAGRRVPANAAVARGHHHAEHR